MGGRAYRNRIRVTSPECSLISRSSYQRNKCITPGAGGVTLPKQRNMSCTVHRRALPDGPHGLGACPGCKLRIAALSIDVPATIIAFDTRNAIDEYCLEIF